MTWWITVITVHILSVIIGRCWDDMIKPDNELGIHPLGMFAVGLLLVMFLGGTLNGF